MPDPLSITTGVVSLVAQSIKAVHIIQSYATKYRMADLSISATRTESSTIRMALLQIQGLLTQSTYTSQVDAKDGFAAYALEEYEGVLGACSITFSVLNERLAELNIHSLDKNGESSFKSKLQAVWNDDEMSMLRQNIRGQAIAINLLLSAFQAGTSAKTYELLKETKNHMILETVSDNARTLLSKSRRARTIRGEDDESSNSVVGDEVFDFDNEVINSTAYRRAYHSYTINVRQNSHPKDKEGEKETTNASNIPNLAVDQILVVRDEDYFDSAHQRLYQHVQQWVLRFSKFSDLRACRLTRELQDERIINRFENAILDGSDVDIYLADRVRRRDVFMSVVMTMIWEYIFTRYLFGLDREQRQKLKSLEKSLGEVGPPSTVALWRAITLTLLSKKPSFKEHCSRDAEAVAHEMFQTLNMILPAPLPLTMQLQESLGRVVRIAADLAIEMRTQRAEYIMLPPLQPEYDANWDLVGKVYFNATLMNERSGEAASNEDLEAKQAVVRFVLFPLVVKKGDDSGAGDDEIVVSPAQVIVAKRVDNLTSRSRVSVAPSVISLNPPTSTEYMVRAGTPESKVRV